MLTSSNAIPPLRQSARETMACPHAYGLVYIEGMKTPDTMASARGTAIHEALAEYVVHCAKKRVPADFLYLDSLTTSSTEEVSTILESCRDNFTVDWQNLFGAEISIGLDRDFQPTWPVDHYGKTMAVDPIWGFESTEGGFKDTAYSGIIDVVYLMPGGKVARIVDFKSHPRPFPADSFQGKLYSLMLFMHLPELTEIEFGLHFVRYQNLVTTQKYFRSDVPLMMEAVRRERNRQQDYHQMYEAGGLDALQSFGSPACTYCPCSLDPIGVPCPNGALNPQLKSPAEMLNWMLSTEVQLRQVKDALKQIVDGTQQPVVTIDGNGKAYTYGPKEKERVTYPLFEGSLEEGFNMPILDALLDWVRANPKDLVPRKGGQPWFNNLRIGATQMNSYLKANNREILHNNIRDLANVETVVPLGITRDAEADDGQGSEYKTYDARGNEEVEF
jgi:hypothetical protein